MQIRRVYLVAFFLAFAVAALSAGNACADYAKSRKELEELYAKATAGSYEMSTKDGPVVCYPSALAEEELRDKMVPPCASKNYIYLPSVGVQEGTFHDKTDIWTDDEVWTPSGAWIWENWAIVGETEVLFSMPVGGMCGTPSSCPFRVRFTKGKESVIKGWPETGMACAATYYVFIRNDLKELLACDEKIPLE